MIDQGTLQTLLSYDPNTGVFRWLISPGSRAKIGNQAGWITNGYRYIKIRGFETTAARLAWLYVYGSMPNDEVEHINGDPLDCRITNLRLATWRAPINAKLTQKRLQEVIHYDERTGSFTWLGSAASKAMRRKKAGCRKPNGYIMISVDGIPYRAHRLAWLYVHGHWPRCHIDHINGDPSDNRITNLREAQVFQNMANAKLPSTNKSGYKGVSWHTAGKKWQAHIRHRGTNIYLGYFDTAQEAHAAYCTAARKLKGRFAREK